MAKQGGFGAVEGAVDYTANYIADKIFRDPNAKFDWRELVSSMGMEGLSEALLGGIGAAGSRINTDTNVPTRVAAQPTLAEQITTMQKQLADIQFQKRVDELAAVYEKNVGEALTSEGHYDSLQSLEESTDVITIGKSVGAKAKNYEVMDLDTGEIFSFVEGSKIQNVEVFAGKDSKSVFRKADKYAARYGGEVHDWQHAKGYALLDTPDGDREAEVHWVQCAGIGKFEFFIKEWLE